MSWPQWCVVVVAACHAAPSTPPKLANEERRHEHVLALARGRSVQFVAIAPPAVTVTRTVDAPAPVAQMRWSADVPVVLLGASGAGDEPVEGHDDEIGLITPHGYERVAAVPEEAWHLPASDPDHGPPHMLALRGDARSVYLSRCERGGFEDGGWCEKHVYAEVVRAGVPVTPPRITHDTPDDLAMEPAPHVTPSPAITVELVDEPPDQVPDGADAPRKLLRCTREGTTTEYPALDERPTFLGMGPITWLRTEPPIYQVTETSVGYDVMTQELTFEGCTPSKTYGDRIAVGPEELVVLFDGDRTAVLQGGHELATLGRASLALFRPEP